MKIRIILVGLLVIAFQAQAGTVDCKDVGDQLNGLASADQKIRQEWESLNQNLKFWTADHDALQKRWRDIDAENLKQVKDIIGACGWPKTKEASHSAWLLAQHADSDLKFQRLARGMLETSVKAGIAAPRDLAYLADRIATNEHRPQEYGTQFSQPDRCHLVLSEVDDLALVKQRRLAIGLQSLEDYEAEGRRRLIPADCATGERHNQ
ncbi:DUF6624 domain-containing protein [uncultured Massilia sp.]|uniref:DUF6624 domain-containing protein n=1 Tax=uncultured Massilia sp. TaxID=169973 RepID=UPI0025FCB6C4|nr:DUF6624 domain-containing protein [uncultured Massilia sp.]